MPRGLGWVAEAKTRKIENGVKKKMRVQLKSGEIVGMLLYPLQNVDTKTSLTILTGNKLIRMKMEKSPIVGKMYAKCKKTKEECCVGSREEKGGTKRRSNKFKEIRKNQLLTQFSMCFHKLSSYQTLVWKVYRVVFQLALMCSKIKTKKCH